MADAQEYAKTQPEVELDTDDVKETDVKVEETREESKEPNLNAGEVDLGYTEHDKDQSKEEVAVEEVQEEPQQETKQQSEPDDLTEVTESVRKRIDKLTRKFREAERREKAALDFAKDNIRANALCPGTIDTPLYQNAIQAYCERSGANPEDVHAEEAACQPLNRLGRAEEVASFALYLASPEASFITGSLQMMDGGYTAR